MSQAQLLPNLQLSPSVSLIKGHPATTSLAIAEHFGKRHANVVRDIRNLCAELPPKERELKFELTSRTVAGPNNSERQEEFFIVYFDGFILLVMGYTGKKALQIKLVYIAAFNAMREKLEATRQLAPLPPTLTPSTTSSRKPLEKLLKVWASQSGTPHAQCWTMLNAAFNLQRVTELPEAWIPDAIAWVQAKIDALPKALPEPEQKALPAVPSPSASFLSAADIAALEAAGQRVIALSTYVHREIHELHVEILNVLDIRRMPAGRWRAMSSHIWYSLLDAVNIAPESLTRDTVTGREYRNPAYWTLEMLKDMPAA